jgi:hypothetical protein
MHNRIILGLLALAAFLPLPFAANPAYAQSFSGSLSAPRIDGFDVESVPKAAPGNELVFTLYGSPGATVGGGDRRRDRRRRADETESGVYEGSYTIRKRDKITPAARQPPTCAWATTSPAPSSTNP